jgi:hypothetical protein
LDTRHIRKTSHLRARNNRETLVTQSANAGDLITVRSSRYWALFHFKLTLFLFPARMVADHVGISTVLVEFWLTPWRRTDEHLPLSHIAEVAHTRGLVWDTISVESSGGLNPLVVRGLPKSAARYFVEHVRERINEAVAPAPARQNSPAPR